MVDRWTLHDDGSVTKDGPVKGWGLTLRPLATDRWELTRVRPGTDGCTVVTELRGTLQDVSRQALEIVLIED